MQNYVASLDAHHLGKMGKPHGQREESIYVAEREELEDGAQPGEFCSLIIYSECLILAIASLTSASPFCKWRL